MSPVVDRTMQPTQVIDALETEVPDRRPVMDRLRREAPTQVLIAALHSAQRSFTRQLLCDLLGFRAARSAVPELVASLDDSDVGVRSAAADAIGKAFAYVGRPPPDRLVKATLPILLRRWEVEPSAEVLGVLATTIALVGDKSVKPILETRRLHPSEEVRAGVTWALDRLNRQ